MAEWAVGGATGSDVSEIAKVRVMNDWDNPHFTGNRQDLLVMIPLPAPLWMGGIGLCGVVGGLMYGRRSTADAAADLMV